MTKMRVHELAKELGMENKELMDILVKKNVEVKSHMSSLADEVVDNIRKGHKGSAAPVAKPAEAKPAADEKAAEDAAPKKKNIVQVFRPQNSKSGGRMSSGHQGQRPQGSRPQGNTQGQRPQGSRPAGAAQGARTQSAASQPASENTQAQRPSSTPAQNAQGQGTPRPSASTQESRQNQSLGQRPYNSNNQRNADGGQRYNNNRGGQERSYDGQNNRNNNGQRQGGYQGNNQRQGGNYQGNGQRQGGGSYQGNNQRQGGGSYQGNGQRQGGYQGNGQRQGGGSYQGNGQRQGGGNYQGNGQRQGGYQGNGQRQGGGYAGNNQRGGNQSSRPGERRDNRRDDRDAIPTPLVEQQKASRNKAKDKEKDYKKKEYKENDFGKKGKKQKPIVEVQKPQPKQEKKVEEIKQIILPEVLTIKELADKMKMVPSAIVKKLFLQGKIVTVNQEIDYETAEEIAMEFEILCEREPVVDVIEELLKEEEEDENTMVKRPPVVCVMGHVDHGKTSLLDAIRHTNVIGREAGGITQHIGAYVVEANGEKITFLDTPGHEAFTAMRMRGANATDIAILVVAADDGVMPQTVEAINHAKAAGIEIIVAINKIDKPSANIDRVKQELAEYELIPEDWGGSTIFVPVSAHTKEGIKDLLEMILLTAEVMELKANPDRAARGLVIEAELDKGKGSVATVLVQKGTLHVGDAIAAGSAHGKVRAMMDDKGRRVKEAGPSQPVEILGLNDVPNAGEVFVGCDTEKEARSFAETFISQNKVKLLDDTKSKMSLDDLFTQIKEGNLKELNIVVKADVQGSVEALKQSLLKLSNDEVVIKIIHGGVGAINESDVILASASNAIIIGFNVRPDATAKEIADREGVDLRLYRVIYNAIEDVEAAMKGMLDPIFEEKVLGHAEVRQTFKASGVGTIAGSYVLDGIFERHCSVRLTRDGIVMFDGPLASLKRFKDDVKEVRAGYECGFVFENYNDIKEGDLVEAYKMVEVERK
ncbi:translation initiation factor IF-2 [Faecalicatena sp. AGMB00832]|uniref:Translation initiation factor IF-2 n=1 Tax=Faecalicatena faecalis TaxID=2726362 RepID=A0ABS6D2B5_9FIRM|nr:translation initiation factor IF-2 [Faecalicatena faecalis]MBU3875734.1 translation initiation factor IF-2 [Faecalicatena faecalis]